jgi:hypothetical protein
MELFDRRLEQLEHDYIGPRSERTKLILTGHATESRLKELEAEEMKALSAILDYKLERRIAESR